MKGIIVLIIALMILDVATADICENAGDIRIWTAPVTWRIRREYVQLCSNNSDGVMKWRYVCDSGWGENEAIIACRQLKYVGMRMTNRKDWYHTGEDEIVTDLNCQNQNATGFSECNFNVSVQSCNYVRGLKCEKCNNGSGCLSPGQCKKGQCECAGPCLNGGVCSLGICQCPVGFSGVQCERCNTSCMNGGECNTIGQCECKQGYYGEVCESKKCSNECLNKGICLSNGTCQCTDGYNGQYCENIINESENISLPNSTEPVTTKWKESKLTQMKTTVITNNIEEENTTHVMTTIPGWEGIIEFDIFSSIDVYAAGFIMIGVSSGIILVLCCCHFVVIVPFILMRRRQRKYKFERVNNPHEAFYEPLQTVVSSHQIPSTQVALFENLPNIEWEKYVEKGDDEEVYTEMKLIYDNRETIDQEVLKEINTEIRKERKLLSLNKSNQLYVQMSHVF